MGQHPGVEERPRGPSRKRVILRQIEIGRTLSTRVRVRSHDLSAAGAVLAPGAGGSSDQPIVRAMAARLAAIGIVPRPISYSRAGRSRDLVSEIDDVRRARDALADEGVLTIALVGRSFGGRVCTRLAAQEPPPALVVLGMPIAPRNRPRPDDEAALAAVTCPTLIVQGEHDALGPLDVLERIAASNSLIEIAVLAGVGHQFGRRQTDGIERAAAWLSVKLA